MDQCYERTEKQERLNKELMSSSKIRNVNAAASWVMKEDETLAESHSYPIFSGVINTANPLVKINQLLSSTSEC